MILPLNWHTFALVGAKYCLLRGEKSPVKGTNRSKFILENNEETFEKQKSILGYIAKYLKIHRQVS